MLVFRGVYKLSIHLSIYLCIYFCTYRALGFSGFSGYLSGIFCCGVFFFATGWRFSSFLSKGSRSSHAINPWTHIRLALTCNCVASCSAGNRTVPVPWFPPLFLSAPKSNDSKQNLENFCDSENWENPSWALQCMKLIFFELQQQKPWIHQQKSTAKETQSKLDFPSHEKGDGGPNSKIDRSKWFGLVVLTGSWVAQL